MGKKSTPLTKEQKMRRRVARAFARTYWRAEFKSANPEASKEELNAAWKAVRRVRTKAGLAVIRGLEKNGITFAGPVAMTEAMGPQGKVAAV